MRRARTGTNVFSLDLGRSECKVLSTVVIGRRIVPSKGPRIKLSSFLSVRPRDGGMLCARGSSRSLRGKQFWLVQRPEYLVAKLEVQLTRTGSKLKSCTCSEPLSGTTIKRTGDLQRWRNSLAPGNSNGVRSNQEI